MRLQAFSPALAFTSTALRTPTNSNSKVASVSAPTSSQRQGFSPKIYGGSETFHWLRNNNPARLPEMAQEIEFILKCFEADWFKTFLSNRDLTQATEALQAELSVSQSSLSINHHTSSVLISLALSSFHDELISIDRARNAIPNYPGFSDFLRKHGREGAFHFNLERRKVYFQELLQQVQQVIQRQKNNSRKSVIDPLH
ncbi:MAG: hypothetical protein ACK551_03225 [Vampirovibrionales bacterium]